MAHEILADACAGEHAAVADQHHALQAVSFVLGGGAYLGSVTVYAPKDSQVDDNSRTVLGLSAQALPMVEVGDGFYLAAGGKLAYHFLLLGHEPDLPDAVDYTGAFDLTASLGFGFRF